MISYDICLEHAGVFRKEARVKTNFLGKRKNSHPRIDKLRQCPVHPLVKGALGCVSHESERRKDETRGCDGRRVKGVRAPLRTPLRVTR